MIVSPKYCVMLLAAKVIVRLLQQPLKDSGEGVFVKEARLSACLILFNEVIAKPSGNIASQCAIPEKCGSGVRVSGKAGGFAISSKGQSRESGSTFSKLIPSCTQTGLPVKSKALSLLCFSQSKYQAIIPIVRNLV